MMGIEQQMNDAAKVDRLAQLERENAELRTMHAQAMAEVDRVKAMLQREVDAHTLTCRALTTMAREKGQEIRRLEKQIATLTSQLAIAKAAIALRDDARDELAGMTEGEVLKLKDQCERQHNRIRMLMLEERRKK